MLALAVGFSALGYAVYSQAHGSLRLPAYAPVTLVLLTLAEGGMERVIRSRRAGSSGPRIHSHRRFASNLRRARPDTITGGESLSGEW